MRKKIKRILNHLTLEKKIRYAFVAAMLPLVLLLISYLVFIISSNRGYDKMINSTVVSSQFSMDFKKDFDYETYLVIVENKSVEESHLDKLLEEAKAVVKGLEEITYDVENLNRIRKVSKYLDNLTVYKERIEENLAIGNKYAENLEIWENDVQIVTALVQDEMNNYINAEIKELQESSDGYKHSAVTMIYLLSAMLLVLIIIMSYLAMYIPSTITKPIARLCDFTDQVANGNLNIRSTEHESVEVSHLSDSVNYMIDQINELLEQVKEEQIRLRKAEFDLLQSQINPHFLYNTLDAIVWLAESGEQKKVVSTVKSLSEFFRATLSKGKDMVTIKEEIVHIKSYLEIQQTRYADIMNYEIDIHKEFYKYLIPKITLQPLVENALYHGIKNKRGMGEIRITAQGEDDYFVIMIRDDGIGIEKERLEEIQRVLNEKTAKDSDIYGLFNVNERIALNFGEEYGIFIESEFKKGTCVEVRLPYHEVA